MKKKIIAILLIGIMVVCNSMVAWADKTTTIKSNAGSDSTDVNATYVVGSGITDIDGDGVPDVDENGNGKDTILDENGDGIITPPTGTEFSVTISWGDMNFKYTSGQTEWDEVKHVYTESSGGNWTPVNSEGNKIHVVNNSNVGILAQVSYEPESPTGVYSNVVGNLYNTSLYTANTSKKYKVNLKGGATTPGDTIDVQKENAFTIPNAVLNQDTALQKTGYLILKGQPKNSWTQNTKIGTVTIAIEYNLESASTDASAADNS